MTHEGSPPRGWFRIEAKASEGDEPTSADVHIYDEIGERWYGGGVGARGFAEQIDALDVDTIRLHLNSPGGAAWDGITIMNSLRRHRARIEVVVDGLAASAASAIAMAGDTITMARGSMLMIHDASGGCWGNAADMEATAGILHKLSDSYADIYAARAGKSREHWREQMRAESWYTAEEAVAAGLADEWSDAESAEARGDLEPRARYDMAMRARMVAPIAPELPRSTEPGKPEMKGAVVTDAFLNKVRERLGVTDAAADEDTVIAALDEALAEQPEAAVVEVLPEGAVVVDAAALAELREQAKAGAEARAQQTADRRDAAVMSAIREGRIAPSARQTWRDALDKAEESTMSVLESLQKNTIPVEEIGHAGGIEDVEDSAYPAHWTGKKEG